VAEAPVYVSTLDATVAGSDADSYVTLTEAKAIATAVGLAGLSAKTDAEFDIALRRACLDVDSHRFHDQVPSVDTQALKFPREKDSDTIPRDVKWAQVLQADWIAVVGESDRKQWEGAKAGPLKNSGAGSPLCPRAFAVLRQYVSNVGTYRD